MTLKIGASAPDFTVSDDSGKKISLKDFKGKSVVLYFYPKDETPGCTQEACDFRDHSKIFSQKNAIILGISKDSVKSHEKFKKNHALPFPLLSDETGEVCEKYGVWVEKQMMGKKYMGIERTTFLINPEGVITQIWPKVKVDGHIQEILSTL